MSLTRPIQCVRGRRTIPLQHDTARSSSQATALTPVSVGAFVSMQLVVPLGQFSRAFWNRIDAGGMLTRCNTRSKRP